MPRRKFYMRRRASAEGLSEGVVAYLFEGPRSSMASQVSPDQVRSIWAQHEETLMHWWSRGFPPSFRMNPFLWLGRSDTWPQPGRPWGWWKFSAPEPRRLLEVYRDGHSRQPTPADEQAAHALGLGRSTSVHEHADGVGYLFENDSSYFARLNIDPASVLPATPAETEAPSHDD